MRGSASSVSRYQQTPPLTANLYFIVEILITRDGPAVIDAKATYWLKIAIFASVGGSPSEWYGKTRMVWLLDGEKNADTFIRFDRIHKRDKHRDRQTDTARRHRPS